jgi:CubicO group peptidase (beta-lactamase class C family)
VRRRALLARAIGLSALAPAALGLAVQGRPALAQASGWSSSFEAWAGRHGVHRGSIAAMQGGRLAHASGLAGQLGTLPGQAASLSKFITACGIARLLAQNRLRLDTQLGRAMPAFFDRNNADRNGTVGQLTVAQLLTHRTGLPQLHGAGREYLPGLRASLAGRHPRAVPMTALEGNLLQAEQQEPAGSAFRYANINFLLLGRLIAALDRRGYGGFISAEVLAPAGVASAMPDPDLPFRDASGGWLISPVAYLAVLRSAWLGNAMLPPSLRAWAEDSADKRVALGSNRHYALGLYFTRGTFGLTMHHDGASRFRLATPAGPLVVSSGSDMWMDANGNGWCCMFAPMPGPEALADLRRSMISTMRVPSGESPDDLFPSMLREAPRAASAR